ncbi:MAG: chemotaxis protein CheA [Candidatus Competibacteraceae bacterium]|nr:chemotaxis protein CheA [Candidatus Competibacteraceae bacterium]MBK7985215.1 chemotaxis protein CheA [Candidatus Competibacteraceae bacterium]MBK8895709.1 chemotaxis protein CheA [Candidatus Competibacteraceae bacterium]MBK9953267.1 chemotaxis protein CheA [Candidatus Competibacteraceae bacterium]
MAIDIGQFVQTFFEESFEGLDVMEAGLLALQPGTATDLEKINTIFRAAHSIKGGSGTFGFKDVTDFTHLMETLLDGMREGRLGVTSEAMNVLLESVDCLREMLVAARENIPVEPERIQDLQGRLARLLKKEPTEAGAGPHKSAAPAEPPPTPRTTGWRIRFKPHPQLMHSGNDPVRMFRELAALGSLTVRPDTARLPRLAELRPEDCYLAWELELLGEVARDAVDDVFAWVEGDCELSVEPLTAESAPERAAKPAAEPVVVPPAGSKASEEGRQGELLLERRKGEDRRRGDRRVNVAASDSASIRVGIDKVDVVINLVGELITTQSMLSALGEDFDMSRLDKLHEALDQLDRNTRDLQEHVMRIRMLPVSSVFSRFPRMVHDVSGKLGKQVELRINGEQTELDKTVIEKIGDPLVHLIRNSLDHGLEPPEERLRAGKPETGVISLDAYHKSGSIFIEVGDDGRGLNRDALLRKGLEEGLLRPGEDYSDEQIYELIFHPGLSTAKQLSDVSGRGVGMDVVRSNIQDVGGSIQIASQPGRGTRITISLPLTLAILDGQLVSVGGDCYIIPLLSIIESVQIKADAVNRVAGKGEVFRFRGQPLPILRLYDLFGTEGAVSDLEKGLLVVVEADGRQIGLFVDDLEGQQQVSIKSLEKNFRRVSGVAGATILGDGRVGLILDISGLIRVNNVAL